MPCFSFMLRTLVAMMAMAAVPVAADVTVAERDAIVACCASGCQDACDWVDENPVIIRPSLTVGSTTRATTQITTQATTQAALQTTPQVNTGATTPQVTSTTPQPPVRRLDVVTDNCCERSGGSGGDPHFMTWTGEYFDYHGQCDLVLLHAPEFGHGLGLTVHVRTKIRYDYSFIESAAVKIGTTAAAAGADDHDYEVLEVGAWGSYLLNGVSAADLPGQLSAFVVDHTGVSNSQHIFTIDLGDDQKLILKTFKDWVSVSFDKVLPGEFKNAKGLMGDYFSGAKLARDGKTVITNLNDFGQEWQVGNDEPALFQLRNREPQYPQKCLLPGGAAVEVQGRRRLVGAVSIVTEDEAEAACEQYDDAPAAKDMCKYDVMASGDLEMAQAGAF